MIAKILKTIILFLIKIRLLSRPKKELFTVVISVLLDGKEIKRFPSEIVAFGRRAARHEIKNRITFVTGTTASNLGKNKDGERVWEVYLIVQLKNPHNGSAKMLQSFPVTVNVEGRREAKFELSKRLTFKCGGSAKVSDLKKHLKKQ